MPVFAGTVYWQAEDRDGILLMSAYCVYCCASPLFLSSVLMAHLNKALGVSTNTDSSPGAPLWLERGARGIIRVHSNHAPRSFFPSFRRREEAGHNYSLMIIALGLTIGAPLLTTIPFVNDFFLVVCLFDQKYSQRQTRQF